MNLEEEREGKKDGNRNLSLIVDSHLMIGWLFFEKRKKKGKKERERGKNE